MTIKNEELETMIKIEHLIISESNAKMFRDLKKKGKCYFNDEEITTDDISKYWNLIEHLIQRRKANRDKTWARIKTKREINKEYAGHKYIPKRERGEQ